MLRATDWQAKPPAQKQNKKADSSLPTALRQLLVLLFWLGVWLLAAKAVDRELLLPGPRAVAVAFIRLVQQPLFWRSAGATLLRILCGFALGMLSGVTLAVLMHGSRVLNALLLPVIRILRATPVASFIILALVWFISGRLPAFIAMLMVLPVTWANTCSGLAQTDPLLLEMAELYRVSPLRIWRQIYWPALRPYLAAAASTGLGLAWKSGVTAEVIASPRFAIGSQLNNAKVSVESAEVFCWTLVVVLLSLGLEALLHRAMQAAERRRPRLIDAADEAETADEETPKEVGA